MVYAEAEIHRASQKLGAAQVDADGASRRHQRHYMQSSMPREPRNRAPTEDPPYRKYQAGSSQRASPSDRSGAPIPGERERPYNVYRSTPRGVLARLRGEEDTSGPGKGKPPRGRRPGDEPGEPGRRAKTAR